MKKRYILLIFILIHFTSAFVMAEGRRDSFTIVNKRLNRISIEVEYVNPIDIQNFGWMAIFDYHENEIIIQGHNHLYEEYPYVGGRLTRNSNKEIYHYMLNPFWIIDEEINLGLIDYIDNISFIERLNRIIKELIIRDRRGNIILTLANINDNMIKGNNGSYYLEVY